MQNNEHKMDDLFRKNLSGWQATPPPEVWDRVAATMGHKRQRRRTLLIWSLSGAASLLLAFLLGWQLKDDAGVEKEVLARLEAIQQQNTSTVVLESKIEQHINIAFDRNVPATSILQNFVERQPVTSREQTPTMNLLAAAHENLPEQFVTFPALVTANDILLSDADRAIIESNLLAMNESRDDSENAWSVGVQGSPVYRFEDMAMGAPKYNFANDAVQNQVAYSYKPNVSAGVSVAYAANKRLAIISGVNYSDVAQSSGGVALSNSGHNWVLSREDAELDAYYGGEALTNTSSSNNLVLNTQIGLANVVLPEGTSLASAKEMNAIVPEVAQNFDYDQHARYVEIPMLMRYKLIDKRLGLHLLGGINTNVLVDNTVRIGNANELLARGQIEGLRTLSWSSSLGMGVNFEVLERIELSLEPMLKVQLNSLNSQQYVNARPYTFGVFSGISYSF